MERCNDWAGKTVASLKPEVVLDVGCGKGAFLYRYFDKIPGEFHGVEGAADLQAEAEARGIKTANFDLNARWPYPDNKFDVVFSHQVIEHLHNTRLFVAETFRVLKPGGTAVITTENLCSLFNWFAITLGYTPFSLMQICGFHLGNPLGLHYQSRSVEYVPIDHPAFSGTTGHVRVMGVRQARELFQLIGFDVQVDSISILPLPDTVSRALERLIKGRGHFMHILAKKPMTTESRNALATHEKLR
jgi:SAM-dependent methyltransferase